MLPAQAVSYSPRAQKYLILSPGAVDFPIVLELNATSYEVASVFPCDDSIGVRFRQHLEVGAS